MRKNYEIKGKTVIAKVGQLTEKELNAVKNYIALGYTLEEYKKKTKPTDGKFTAEAVQNYLENHGTKAQKETYFKIYNEPTTATYKNDVYKTETVTDENGKTHKKNVLDENGNKIIIHKAGDKRIKGHIPTLKWFRNEFPNYPEE